MPQKQTHQIAMIALRSAAPVNGGGLGQFPRSAAVSS
jgi:hypothetical protein